jgi:hypothetical protein
MQEVKYNVSTYFTLARTRFGTQASMASVAKIHANPPLQRRFRA